MTPFRLRREGKSRLCRRPRPISDPVPESPTKPNSSRRKRWRWLRWTLLVLGILIVAFLALLRPIAFFVARFYADRLGRNESLKIAFEPGGNLWSSLSFDRLQISPTAPGTVRDIRIGRFKSTYSLWAFLRSGLRDFVDEVEVEDVTIVLDVSRPPPPPTSGKDEPGGGIPRFPLPRKALFRNVTLVLEQPGGRRIEFTGLTLELVPGGDGSFEIKSMSVPGLKPILDIRGSSRYANRELSLRDVNLPGVARFQDITIQLEKLSTGWLIGSASGEVLGGRLDLKASVPASLHLWEYPGSGSLSIRALPISWPSQILVDPAVVPPQLSGMVDEFDASFGNREKDEGRIDVHASTRIRELRVNELAAATVAAGLNAVVSQATLKGGVPWFTGLVAELTGEVTQPQTKDLAADRAGIRITTREDNATIEALEIVRGSNVVSLAGRTKLSPELARWKWAALALDLRIQAPDLGQLSLAGEAPPLQGRLEGGGKIALAAGAWTGNMALSGRDLRIRDLAIQSLDVRISAAQEVAWIEQCEVRIDADNAVALGGYARLAGDRDFRADVNVNLPKLAAFEALLRAAGVREKLGGALKIEWRASGQLIDFSEFVKTIAGGGTIAARGVTYGGSGPFDGDIEGSQGGARIDLPTISLRAGPVEFRGSAQLVDSLVSVERISVRRVNDELAGGYVRVPVDLNRMKIADVDKIDVDLVVARPLPLAELWTAANLKGRPPLDGTVAFSLKALGSLSKLTADLSLQGRGLRKPDFTWFKSADLDLALSFRENRLTADGAVKQPQMQPVSLRGEMPIDLPRLVETGKLDLAAPITGSIRLPPSSLNVAIGVVPGLRFVQGDAGADITIGGTLGKPTLRGSLRADLTAARFENLSVPALRDFKIRLAFDEKEVRLEQVQGEVAGGRFFASGRADYNDWQKGTIHVAIKTTDVLALRDDSITVRVNSDLTIDGPVASALVKGRVALTKSRFLKDIDILPISLPGEQKRPATAPPPPKPRNTGADIGIKIPPMRDWKFDVAIVTADPFRVRGNLANGRVVVDLKLTGTGEHPLLKGPVTIEQLTARLPFSRLDIAYGSIYFTPDQPFNPLLDISGQSQVRDRRIDVTIYGRADDPKTVFTSDPPLPQEQIVTLLATGSTLDELRSDTGALVGKAAILTAQSLWRKVFKSKDPPSGQDSLGDRFDVDIGATDPKTGKQSVSARFRVSDRVLLLSDFDSQGNFRGQVRYLIRFR